MNRRAKHSSHSETGPFVRFMSSAVILQLLFYAIWHADDQIKYCRNSILSLPVTKMTLNNSLSQCNIPYEECRCSVSSDKFNNSKNCITDIQAMGSHILPPISFVLQLYVIYDLFSFSSAGGYWNILLGILWLIALFVFIIVAIRMHGISCLYFSINWIVGSSSLFLLLPIVYLVVRRDMEERSRGYRRTDRVRKSAKIYHDGKTSSLVIVP